MNHCNHGINSITENKIDDISAKIVNSYSDGKGINFLECSNLPQQSEIIKVLTDILEMIFPGYYENNSSYNNIQNTSSMVQSCYNRLVEQISRALNYYCKLSKCPEKNCSAHASEVAYTLLQSIPSIRQALKHDIEAAMEGDPAATSQDEIIISYPGLKAISVYRIANILYQQKVPLIPRVMSEHAHSQTGIDIHPGATIAEGFFIDHGTGVVIGETAILGKKVKIYQGVTLGALSFPKDENGYAIRGEKRHPSIAENVTIYAGATILGDILIGENSVIGGNVWLMDSIPPNTLVTIDKPALTIRTRK